ncbi:MAG: hypothetical protein CFE45_30340, partial [Burkholderiales bacterium PBB5]
MPVAAQQAMLEPSAALACLTPADVSGMAPEYPFLAYKQGDKGRVQVQLTFTGPGEPPAMTVLAQEGDDTFVEAVRTHVRRLRVPCHDGGKTPVKLLYDFVFRPDARQVQWLRPTDAADQGRLEQLACLVHVSGGKAPEYPTEAARAAFQRRVLARLRFEASDRAPVVEILSQRDAINQGLAVSRLTRLLTDQVADWAAGYRLPCLS